MGSVTWPDLSEAAVEVGGDVHSGAAVNGRVRAGRLVMNAVP